MRPLLFPVWLTEAQRLLSPLGIGGFVGSWSNQSSQLCCDGHLYPTKPPIPWGEWRNWALDHRSGALRLGKSYWYGTDRKDPESKRGEFPICEESLWSLRLRDCRFALAKCHCLYLAPSSRGWFSPRPFWRIPWNTSEGQKTIARFTGSPIGDVRLGVMEVREGLGCS